jgi:hypothetical protein
MKPGRLVRWHWGKIVILWAWGGVIVALLLTVFLSSPAGERPALSSFAFMGSLAILIALSSVTWVWLGGKE